jgi:anthranilate phosphoribosyltransferase
MEQNPKSILQHLLAHKTLDTAQACNAIKQIAAGTFSDAETAAFITVYLMRSITIPELQGFRQGLLEMCRFVDLGMYDTMDIVGTGGDGKDTFNISTLACFIVAGAGQKVAKHGNYGASSISGASNVMEYLGYKFKQDESLLQQELEETGFCFLHAPLFHPALKQVAHIRKQLGIRTFFNLLGPLVNPSGPAYKMIGVYNPETARIYNYLLQQEEHPFAIVHSLDGYDEISLTGDVKLFTRKGEQVFNAMQLGKRTVEPASIRGGSSVKEAAQIFTNILHQKGTWSQNAVVLANAAMALYCTNKYDSYEAAYTAAVESLESGKALAAFNKLIQLQ